MYREFSLSAEDFEKLRSPEVISKLEVKYGINSVKRVEKVKFKRVEFSVYTESPWDDELYYGGSVEAIYEVTFDNGSSLEHAEILWEELD